MHIFDLRKQGFINMFAGVFVLKPGWYRGTVYTNALNPVMARPTMSELISLVPS